MSSKIKDDNRFVDIEFSIDTLDTYHIRSSIFASLERHLDKFSGTLLDIGCGQMPYRKTVMSKSSVTKYIGLDLKDSEIHNTSKADILWDGTSMPIDDCTIDCAIATEVLEHCYDPHILLTETRRVLKPGGIFFFTVPFLWPLHEVPYDEYRYTPYSLHKLLTDSGFVNISIYANGGWHASLAQMLGLWVRRANMTSGKRQMLSFLLKPIIGFLLKKDRLQPVQFQESQMLTNLHGISFRPE